MDRTQGSQRFELDPAGAGAFSVDLRADVAMTWSPGTVEAGPPGGPAAYFPRAEWHEAGGTAAAGSSGAAAGRSDDLGGRVTVVRMGTDIVNLARRELFPLLAGDHDPGCRMDALRRVRDALEDRLEREHGVRAVRRGPADCVVHRPGLASTAFDFDTGHFIGLHIDNHQHLPLADRARADVLFAVNIGLAHRYLVFVPSTVEGMLARIAPDDPSPASTDSIVLKDEFLRRHPDEPVARIRLEPGDAYLAGPQNLIHDGATNEVGSADVALLMSGSYR